MKSKLLLSLPLVAGLRLSACNNPYDLAVRCSLDGVVHA